MRTFRFPQKMSQRSQTLWAVWWIHIILMRIRIRLIILMRIRILILFDADADPDLTLHADADPNPAPSFQIKAQNLEWVLKQAHIWYILAYYLQIDADPDPVLDPSYHFDADPDANPDPDFYLMRMRIQVTKNDADPEPDADPDPQHCLWEAPSSNWWILFVARRCWTCWGRWWRWSRLPSRRNARTRTPWRWTANRMPSRSIEFIDWRYSQSCWYFRQAWSTIAPLTFSG